MVLVDRPALYRRDGQVGIKLAAAGYRGPGPIGSFKHPNRGCSNSRRGGNKRRKTGLD
jgi:hypothetical protein